MTSMKAKKSKKNKGKVHPCPASASSNDAVSRLNNLLPTAILTLISILSLQDKQVLAYMITHCHTDTHHSLSLHPNKVTHKGKKGGVTVPCFECGCFECYTSYWIRWDSSPHRELIHQAIEAFETVNNPEVTAGENGECSSPEKEGGGLGRKGIPDVIGLFNSRLWNLWGPIA